MLLLGMSLLWAAAAGAETLAQVRQEALEANPALAAARASVRAAESLAAQRGWWPEPRLQLAFLNLPVSDPRFDRTPMSGKQLMLMQEVPFWSTHLAGAAAQEGTAAVQARMAEQEWEVRRQVTAQYFLIRFLDRSEEILGRELGLMRRLAQTARTQYERGSGLEQDALRAQVESSLLENQVLEIQQQRLSAQADMAALLGREAGAEIRPEESADGLKKRRLDEKDLTAGALENNPRSRSLAARERQARWQRRLADEAWIPELQVAGSYTWRDRVPGDPLQGEDFFGAAVGIKLPLWFFSQEIPASREAAARAEQARSETRGWELQLTARIQDSLQKLARLEKSEALFREKIVPQTRAAVDSSLTAFQTGRTDFLNVINNETSLIRFEIAYEEILKDYETEVARLEELTGREIPTAPEEAGP